MEALENLGPDPARPLVHGTAVQAWGRGVLFIGASGAGKSGAALHMLALGSTLIADDRVQLDPLDGRIMMSAPDELTGKIEARGIGILSAPTAQTCALDLLCYISQSRVPRLQPPQSKPILGTDVAWLTLDSRQDFIWGLIHFLKHGRAEI